MTLDLDFLSIAVIVADVKEPIKIPGLELQDGDLAIVRDGVLSPQLNEKQLQSIEFGGGGNCILPSVQLGIKAGLMGFIGDDPVGRYYSQRMMEFGVDTTGLIVKPEYKTDISFIPSDETGNRAPILFFEDAGKYFDLLDSQVQDILTKLTPKVILVSYSGLFEKGADLYQGQRMRDGIKWIHETMKSIVMVDTHTYSREPEKYENLKNVLREADMFFCSDDEMALIINQFGMEGNLHMEKTSKKREVFLDYLNQNFTGFYGITSADTILVSYKGKKTSYSNPFYGEKTEIFDTTGAGDSFKAGLCCYIGKNLHEFKNGNLNLREAIYFACLTARLYISGKNINAFKDFKYNNLLKAVQQVNDGDIYRSLASIYAIM